MKKAILTSFILLSLIGNAKAQGEDNNKYFDGLYFGVSIGSQNIFGGAHIDDLDLLAQKNTFVLEVYPGFRKQLFNDRMMIGFELQFGFAAGDMTTYNPRYQWEVRYENSFQHGYGLSAGVVLGTKKNTLVYTYGRATNRSFDITFTEDTGFTHHQKDGQYFLRYGLGIERVIREKLNVSLMVGGIYVDFGDLVTSQKVNDAIDVNLGLVYQF
ncbi:outer membrane protein [Reichenbachiella sp.]|uniref:outer membrane protein n=1 Tax=Reichenbachiella sp. TaxID=2184521 RepID=UPI003B5BCD77